MKEIVFTDEDIRYMCKYDMLFLQREIQVLLNTI